jgi:hypothetical protein
MNLSQARDYFARGIITKIFITSAVLETGYHIVFHEKDSFTVSVMETAIGQPKLYKLLNSANSDILRITGWPQDSITFAVFTKKAFSDNPF